MCGIVGFWDATGLGNDAEAVIGRMAAHIKHRGPDDSGTWVDREVGIALGHRRLSILDLSAAGHQPMQSACGRYVIVFNGEIYNHLSLRARLEEESAAPAWRGHSDTETLLACFAAWGVEATLKATVGMFAFAAWDCVERRLVLARDRLGEKPLYYGRQGRIFFFASELKAVRAHPMFKGRISRHAIALLLRYNCIPSPFSIYEGIHKLPPGHLLRLDPYALKSGATVPAAPWWTLSSAIRSGASDPFEGGPDEAVDEIERALAQAVRDQMISDVPLGAFLSGGVDSSCVVALMQSTARRKVKTFTIGFDDMGFDEAPHARAVAEHLGTEHHELHVGSWDALELVPRLPAMYCEPFADSSQIPTFLVSQLARQHVIVSLSGDGGDEVFGGYNRYLDALATWQRTRRLPRGGRRMLAGGLRAVPPGAWDAAFRMVGTALPSGRRLRYAGEKAHKLAAALLTERVTDFYSQLRSHWPNPAEVVVDADGRPLPAMEAGGLDAEKSPEQWMMAQDTQSYLPDDILVKVDRAAMATSLETRVPILDHRVVEAVWQMPVGYKIRDGQSKWLLRQVLYRHVPRTLIERPKTGFTLPLDAWLRGPLRDWAEDLLEPTRLSREGYIRPGPIRDLWQRHLAGRANGQYLLWDVLMFQAWLADQTKAG